MIGKCVCAARETVGERERGGVTYLGGLPYSVRKKPADVCDRSGLEGRKVEGRRL
jgi:hypothetical protein